MTILSYVIAALCFVLAVLWAVVGAAGLRRRLRRNRFLGVRSEQTMRSETAFAVANQVAAPGYLGAAAVLVVGGVLSLGGGWFFGFGLASIVAALVFISVISGYAIRAAEALEDTAGGGCSSGCCSPAEGAADDAAAAAADCGTDSCGSCTLRNACSPDHPVEAGSSESSPAESTRA